jgi:hypothetical protein
MRVNVAPLLCAEFCGHGRTAHGVQIRFISVGHSQSGSSIYFQALEKGTPIHRHSYIRGIPRTIGDGVHLHTQLSKL